ncbi:hypothetical protein [Chitinilyticum litopenaei]|nr:hypothetical protein [Chitinilyticum litopenaei]
MTPDSAPAVWLPRLLFWGWLLYALALLLLLNWQAVQRFGLRLCGA